MGHTDFVNGAAFSPDGQTIATASSDKTARLWDTKTGKEIRRFLGHNDIVYSVTFSPDGRTLATASADRTARLWMCKPVKNCAASLVTRRAWKTWPSPPMASDRHRQQ